jgi:hypothetical protein
MKEGLPLVSLWMVTAARYEAHLSAGDVKLLSSFVYRCQRFVKNNSLLFEF